MTLEAELLSVANAAAALAGEGESLTGVLPAEAEPGLLVFLCAFEAGERRTWLVLDPSGEPVTDRQVVRDAASIAAACELAEDCAGGGNIQELRARLLEIRLAERPEGIEEAERAAADLEFAIEPPPRIARPAYLDTLGLAATRLEQALGESTSSPFAEAMKLGMGAVEEFTHEVESGYRRGLG